jgi:predicted Zn-dependent protease
MFVPAAEITTGIFAGGVSNAGAYYGMNYGFQGMGTLLDKALVRANGKAQKEADQLGIQYAWNSGFDPKGFITFLDSVATVKDTSGTDSFFLTRLPLGERLVDAFTEVEFLSPKRNYTTDSEEFRNVKERLQQEQRGNRRS